MDRETEALAITIVIPLNNILILHLCQCSCSLMVCSTRPLPNVCAPRVAFLTIQISSVQLNNKFGACDLIVAFIIRGNITIQFMCLTNKYIFSPELSVSVLCL